MSPRPHASPGTVVFYGDIACPWSHLATYRLFAWRQKLGLEDAVAFDMRGFPLELVNGRCTPKRVLDAEVPVAGALEPDAGWQMWQEEDWTWPVTSLPALEAVQAAKEQSLEAGARLAQALRSALFADSRCISMQHVILDVARETDGVDADAVRDALEDGRVRGRVFEQFKDHSDGHVTVSPHVFLPDGTDVQNPGVTLHWEGPHGRGFPIVDSDDPAVYEDILRRAAS